MDPKVAQKFVHSLMKVENLCVMDPERLAKCLVSHPKLRNIIIASVRISKRHLPEGKIVVNVLESPDDETDLVEISVKEPDVGEDFEETKNV